MDLLMDLLFNIVETFFDVILNLLSLLPMSPFMHLIEDLSGFEWLGYMNYFIPFGAMANVMNVWLVALTGFYVYQYVTKLTDKVASVGKH